MSERHEATGCSKPCELMWDMYEPLQTVYLHLNASLPVLTGVPAHCIRASDNCSVVVSLLTD